MRELGNVGRKACAAFKMHVKMSVQMKMLLTVHFHYQHHGSATLASVNV